MSVNISLMKKMYDILMILVDFCGNYPWCWLIFCYPLKRIRMTKMKRSKRIRSRNTAFSSAFRLKLLIIPFLLRYLFDDKLVTVWSAPNYCYRCGNVASILEIDESNCRTPKMFDAVPDGDRVVPARTVTPYFL